MLKLLEVLSSLNLFGRESIVVAKMTVYPDFLIHNAKKYSRMGKILTKISTLLIFYALLIKKRQLSGEKYHPVVNTP